MDYNNEINNNVLRAGVIAARLLKNSLKEMGTAGSQAKMNQCAANAMLCVKVLEFIADHSEGIRNEENRIGHAGMRDGGYVFRLCRM